MLRTFIILLLQICYKSLKSHLKTIKEIFCIPFKILFSVFSHYYEDERAETEKCLKKA